MAVNDFEVVVPGTFTPVAEALEALRNAGLPLALLSGSGGAVFGVLPPGADGAAAVSDLRDRAPGIRWVVTSTLERLPDPVWVEPEAGIH